MSKQTLTDMFSALVEQCASGEAGREALKMYNHTVQFTPLDGEPFHFIAKEGQAWVRNGVMPDSPLPDAHEIKADSQVFREWFSGQERMSDLIEHGCMFPVASHTTKRHIDHWLAKIVRLGSGLKIPKEVF
ncbi:MAG: hypothetical protein U0401_27735 [Anaerolineae bacterium]